MSVYAHGSPGSANNLVDTGRDLPSLAAIRRVQASADRCCGVLPPSSIHDERSRAPAIRFPVPAPQPTHGTVQLQSCTHSDPFTHHI
ncbi:hypothetical protein [Rhodococcus sp. (in: high G+C Gram-positive bacteria)]|uniref:hypothetical protein n=1 Tax=Rhodococcus sp. TaxID=1831 RepID=UPI00257FC80D|nr:hypothetical protein [Rhodococcus sp. (in: high G+C Gram-positive bacteria)]MBQ7804042.1 hypothetical protein [Rhodococcus sp. (in: high G+C Gram-positive bacteria)]